MEVQTTRNCRQLLVADASAVAGVNLTQVRRRPSNVSSEGSIAPLRSGAVVITATATAKNASPSSTSRSPENRHSRCDTSGHQNDRSERLRPPENNEENASRGSVSHSWRLLLSASTSPSSSTISARAAFFVGRERRVVDNRLRRRVPIEDNAQHANVLLWHLRFRERSTNRPMPVGC